MSELKPPERVEVDPYQPPGIDYVTLLAIVVLGAIGCLSIWRGDSHTGDLVIAAVAGFVTRLYVGK